MRKVLCLTLLLVLTGCSDSVGSLQEYDGRINDQADQEKERYEERIRTLEYRIQQLERQARSKQYNKP